MDLDEVMLARIIRPRMRSWWRRYGWPWLLLIALAQLSALVPLLANPGGLLAGCAAGMQKWTNSSSFMFLLFVPYGLPAALWLWSASLAMRAPEAELERAAAPRPENMTQLLFRSALYQGIPVMLLCAAGIAIYNIGVCAAYGELRILPMFTVVSGGLESLAFAIGFAIWLIALQVTMRNMLTNPVLATLPIVLSFSIGYFSSPAYDLLEQLFGRYTFQVPVLNVMKSPSPVIIGLVALGIAIVAIWTLSERGSIAAIAALSVSLGLNAMTYIQVLPVSIGRTYWVTEIALKASGLQPIYDATWGLYHLSYTTGGGWYVDTGAFGYPFDTTAPYWREAAPLLIYIFANVIWLWLQYRFLLWLLRRNGSVKRLST